MYQNQELMGKNKCTHYICKYNVHVISSEMKLLILHRGSSFNSVNLENNCKPFVGIYKTYSIEHTLSFGLIPPSPLCPVFCNML